MSNIVERIERELLINDHSYCEEFVMTELWYIKAYFRLNTDEGLSTIRRFLIRMESLILSDYEERGIDVLHLIQKIRESELCHLSHLASIENISNTTDSDPLTYKNVSTFIDQAVIKLDKMRSYQESELVKKELTALNNFVKFMGKLCTSELQSCWQTLLRHVEFVGALIATVYFVDAGHLLSGILHDKIKPIQPQVRGIYTDVLTNLKISPTPSTCDESFMEATDEFIHSLLHVIKESMEFSSLTKDKSETFHQLLNLLRYLLKELLLIKDIQDEMRIGFSRSLVAGLVDAGLIVYLLCDENKDDWDGQLLHLDNKIQFVKNTMYYTIREWVLSHLPKNDALGFSECLLENLKELLSGRSAGSSSIDASVMDQLKLVQKELEFFQPFVRRTVAEQGDNALDEVQRRLIGRVIDKAYEIEYIVDSFEVGGAPLTLLTTWLSEIIREIDLIKTELTKKSNRTSTSHHTASEELVGFGDVWETIRGQLVKGSPKLDVVSIVGMAGSGKTTIARSFINDDSIVSHFNLRAECRVSQKYIRRDLLLSILKFADYDPVELSKQADDELADRLRKTLLTKRCFLIIDDVWEQRAWDDLKLCFRGGSNGSRIILTTRLKEIAIYAEGATEPHYLRPLSEQESWLLLQKKVFGQEICPEELEEVGRRIAKKCNGLPLSLVLVAGLLTKVDKTERCWMQMESSFGGRVQDGAKDLVKLSYNDLPNKLKPCVLYFGSFLEDRDTAVSKLTSLWLAEAFIEGDEEKCLEDIAEDYLEDLVGRNLVMVSKRRSNGKIKACRLHDLMLDFCKEKAADDNFLLWPKRDQNANPPHFYSEKPLHRRLSFCSNQDDLAEWRPACSHARSLLFREVSDNTCSSMGHASIIFRKFKFLRVLDLEFVVVKSFPTELDYLRYLAFQTTEHHIPSTIRNLWNLQTFIVKKAEYSIELPLTFWELKKLRHVSIENMAWCDYLNVTKSPSKLENLATLSTIFFSGPNHVEMTVSKTPNLRKLSCIFSNPWPSKENETDQFPILESLSQLEKLKLDFNNIPIVPPGLNFPTNLRELTLCSFPFTPAGASIVGNLHSLEVLKLQRVSFEDDEWEVGDNEFPRLKFLKLEILDLIGWKVSEEAFSCLEKLVMRRCYDLAEIPSCFEDLGCLQYIEVKLCGENVANLAKDIRETRVENGHRCDIEVVI